MKGSPNLCVQENIKSMLHYDPISGSLRWKRSPSTKVKVGDSAGTKQHYGHLEVGFEGKRFMAHHIAWFLAHGCWPDIAVKHANGNRADNSLTNLIQ